MKTKEEPVIEDFSKHGHFCIREKDILALLWNKATTAQVLSYMCILRYKHATGASSAGYSVIRRKLGIGTIKAKKILDELQSIEHNGSILLNKISHEKTKFINFESREIRYTKPIRNFTKGFTHIKLRFRWYIYPNFGKLARFTNDFLDRNDSKSKLFRSLIKRNNHELLGLLLLLHLNNSRFFNIVNHNYLCTEFKTDYLFSENGYSFFQGKKNKILSVSPELYEYLFGIDQENIKRLNDKLEIVLKELESMGLLQRVVIVFMFDACAPAKPTGFYEIDIKTSDYLEKHSCHTMATKMRKIAQARINGVGRKDSRFYDEYVVAVPDNKIITLCETYRLKYAVRNSKYQKVTDGLKMRGESTDQINQMLHTFNL